MSLFALYVFGAMLTCLCGRTDAVTGFTETAFTITVGPNTKDITGSVKATQAEDVAAGTTLFTLTATKTTAGNTVSYVFTSAGNPGDVGAIATSADVATITLATGKSFDFETTPAITFVILATETNNAPAGTATLTLSVTNVLEFSAATLTACVVDGSAAGTTVGTYTVSDAATGETIAYSVTGGDAADFIMAPATGVLTKKAAADAATKNSFFVPLKAALASGTGSGAGSSTLTVSISATCSTAAQWTAAFGVFLLSFLTTVSM